MNYRFFSPLSILLCLFLVNCSGQFTTEAPPTQMVPTVTEIPPEVSPILPSAVPVTPIVPTATELPTLPVATEPPVVATAILATPVTGPPIATLQGQVVLQLSNGSGDGQVGITTNDSLGYQALVGADSFRIGSDGSIRLLDSLNKRLLFFTAQGQFTRAAPIAEAVTPTDFIVDPQGQVYIFDRGILNRETFLWEGGQVLRYGPDGNLAEAIEIAPQVAADGILRTANDDLLLVHDNQRFWTIIRDGARTPLPIQPLTAREGAATPRSPVIFRVTPQDWGLEFYLTDLAGSSVPLGVPTITLPPATFFNVDRAMNLYFTGFDSSSEVPGVSTWRVDPEGNVVGGGFVGFSGCKRLNWRTFYIDQAGAAWSLCVNDNGATITRYDLLDLQGAPLPPAPNEPSTLASWRPGVPLEFTAA
jgi:hypothetical protein